VKEQPAPGFVPSHAELASLLDEYAPLSPCPLVPELMAFHATTLLAVWDAVEKLAGRHLPAPFWAYPWPAGVALARTVLDNPEYVAGLRVLDVGCGGGIAALAAARAGALDVIANDIDPMSVGTTMLAAQRQGIDMRALLGDLTLPGASLPDVDVVFCADLAYERRHTPAQRALLARFRGRGTRVFVANAERKYFSVAGLRELAQYRVQVPQDLEGVESRLAAVYELV
jgi:predicted nicotinamide N-methyase